MGREGGGSVFADNNFFNDCRSAEIGEIAKMDLIGFGITVFIQELNC